MGEVVLRVRLLRQWGWLNLRHGFHAFLDYAWQEHAVTDACDDDAGDVNQAEFFVTSHEEVDQAADTDEDRENPPKGFSGLEGFYDSHDVTHDANDDSNECEDSSDCCHNRLFAVELDRFRKALHASHSRTTHPILDLANFESCVNSPFGVIFGLCADLRFLSACWGRRNVLVSRRWRECAPLR